MTDKFSHLLAPQTSLTVMVARIIAWPARAIAQRAAMMSLNGLSDWELKDIGIVRQEIADVVKTGRPGRLHADEVVRPSNARQTAKVMPRAVRTARA